MTSSLERNQEELIRSLKQLFINIGPKIRNASSLEEAEDAFLRLEETDPDFHRYDVVKNLHNQIDLGLEELIDEQINNHSVRPNDSSAGLEVLVSKIVEEIIQSPEYSSIRDELRTNLKHVSDYFLSHIDVLLPSSSASARADVEHSSRRWNDESDSESSIGDSSLNQSIMFMSPEQYQNVADNLHANNVEARQRGLRSLLQIASLNIHGCSCWGRIRQGILSCLADHRESLWTLSLHVIARSLSGSSSSGGKDSVNKNIKEMYIILVEFIKMWFETHARVIKDLDINQPEAEKILKCVRLLNDFQQQVTQYWIRCEAQFLEDILDATIGLCAFQPHISSDSVCLTPLHLVALVDTKAGWFIKWMHGHFSQGPLMERMHGHQAVVTNAVRSCMMYATSYNPILFADSSRNQQDTEGSPRPYRYTGAELEYAYFVHSLYMIGRLLWYQSGRDFFPLQLPGRGEKVTLSKLLMALTSILTANQPDTHHQHVKGSLAPTSVVADVLKKLCASESVCQKTMCKNEITGALLQPFFRWLQHDSQDDDDVAPFNNAAMLHAADVLSAIASTAVGRHHLLYGESGQLLAKKRDAAVHLLGKLAHKLLLEDSATASFQSVPSTAVAGNIVFICRQLYSACEGLHIMFGYKLHETIAQAWRVAHHDADSAPTPTPSVRTPRADPLVSSRDSPILWEESLRDNLLNFAATPKGLLLLLQQLDAIGPCVDFMFSRYSRKMQVSRCEKFGYGYMMSQLAATASGMSALQQTGFVKALLKSVWAAVEVIEDNPTQVPRTWPVMPIDKSANKCFMKLVTLLSSYPSVVEALGQQIMPNKDCYTFREIPETIPELFDRLVMLDSESKIHSLFNYEQSHIFGLRLLSCMVTCLDTFLLLQSQFNIQGFLLRSQANNMSEISKVAILDMISLECNHILVRTFLLGGPTERKIPPRYLQEDDFQYPVVASFPIPAEYLVDVNWFQSAKSDGELVQFIADVKKLSTPETLPSVDKCRRILTKALVSKTDTIPLSAYQDLLEYVAQMFSSTAKENSLTAFPIKIPDNSVKSYSLTREQELGIDLTLRYGSHVKLLTNNKDIKERLVQLVKRSIIAIQSQQQSHQSELRYLKSGTTGYDWFVATIFILFEGNLERCWSFLQRFSTHSFSALLWMQRIHLSSQLSSTIIESSVHPVFYKTCHIIELILQVHEPSIYSAFKMTGYTPAQICQHWIRQCFWNYLDWPDICQYLLVCLVLGVDYQVYVCVAILHFLHKDIVRRGQDRELIVFLKEEPIRDFHVRDHMQYMKELETKYREIVLEDMSNVLTA